MVYYIWLVPPFAPNVLVQTASVFIKSSWKWKQCIPLNRRSKQKINDKQWQIFLGLKHTLHRSAITNTRFSAAHITNITSCDERSMQCVTSHIGSHCRICLLSQRSVLFSSLGFPTHSLSCINIFPRFCLYDFSVINYFQSATFAEAGGHAV